ncbi:bacterioferritin [Azospirillum sp. A39]|uniref:bacterioferritin n=1 Tax=Azospirillum sp. A39 TaxID=3462279 RepID=UPI00404622AF
MKGDPKIIRHLNTILTNELTAINQYFLHARILKHWGLERIAHKVYEESIGEMKHADKLTVRILFLDGLPNYQDLHKLQVGEELPEMLTSDLGIESHNRTCLQEAIAACEEVRDYESREILEEILADTEEHIDWLETQLDLIQRVGLQAYQQEQLYRDDD